MLAAEVAAAVLQVAELLLRGTASSPCRLLREFSRTLRTPLSRCAVGASVRAADSGSTTDLERKAVEIEIERDCMQSYKDGPETSCSSSMCSTPSPRR